MLENITAKNDLQILLWKTSVEGVSYLAWFLSVQLNSFMQDIAAGDKTAEFH